MIRRALAFVGLGPLVTYLTFRVVAGPSSWTAFNSDELVVLMLAYAIGFVPALVMAGIDQTLADRRLRFRPMWSGLCAIGIVGPFVAMGMFAAGRWSAELLLWPLLISIPTLICSGLAGSDRSEAIATSRPPE